MTTKRDMDNQIAYAMEKGEEKGMEKGMEKGRAEERIAIAAKMKQLGIPAEQIAQSTGIPVEEIKGL